MLWTIALILLIFWILGLVFKVAGAFVHILLLLAIIVGLIQLFTGSRGPV
ncbi:MAG TPA: lmo0937 family membrane protein [Candidatus Limnocylindrales bacterium]|nr:lmo0937 family membrane protein [Candidatus Limnocylindrales bacterium]